MTSQPLVSVIIPTYKRGEYLTKALESVLAQTYRHTEILVSDNAASEEVAALVASYGDPRLRYRHNGVNIGATRNALAAYREARGQYISTLHDDDMWAPTFLQELVPPLAADSDLALSFSDHWIMRPDDGLDREATEENTRQWGRQGLGEGLHRPFYQLALVDRAISIVASVIRKSVIDWNHFPEEVGAAYDLWMVYLASRDGHGAWYSPRRLLRYRVHEGAASATRDDRPIVYCFSSFIEDERLCSIRAELLKERAVFDTNLGISLLRRGRSGEARRPLLRGLAHRPELRGLVSLALSFVPGAIFHLVDRTRGTLLTDPSRAKVYRA